MTDIYLKKNKETLITRVKKTAILKPHVNYCSQNIMPIDVTETLCCKCRYWQDVQLLSAIITP